MFMFVLIFEFVLVIYCASANASEDYFNQESLQICIPKPKSNESAIVNILNNAIGSQLSQEVIQDILHTKLEIMYLCIFAFIVSLVVVFLIPFFTCFVVWGVIHGVVVVSIGGTIYLWITWKEMSDFEINNNQVPQKFKYTYFSYALIATTFTITILLFIFKMRCHIAFVIQLHKESGKAISSMPILLLQPVGTFIFMCLSLNIWVYFGLIIEGSGYKQFEPLSRTIYYHKDDLMEFSKIYNIFVLIWIIQFIIGCQDMIIARCVSTWFFTRNKDDVTDPISCSIKYLLKHHLGSVTIRQCFANYLQNYSRRYLKTKYT
ncbi:choline transporter-like protein 1 [Acyrthosiphon pisum]|uniref:Choline transporter-like protein n=1 Tax=Acyrthosiphon pisum TaxID=7029 RepID=A0A8R2NRI2_ACYPI|nr:choline transporter-like protein 1 [Acyrthosiphon pisum]